MYSWFLEYWLLNWNSYVGVTGESSKPAIVDEKKYVPNIDEKEVKDS